MTDSDGGLVRLRREPSYSGLDGAEQQRAVRAVDAMCPDVALDRVLPRVVVPAALDDDTRQVLELRRRDGYQVPAFLELTGYARSRVEDGADPDVFLSDWQLVNGDGKNPPRRPLKSGDYLKEAGWGAVQGLLLCFILVCLLGVGSLAFGISDAVLGKLVVGMLIATPVVSALGSAAGAVTLRRFDNAASARTREIREDAARYELTPDHIAAIRRHAVPIDPQWPEVRLALVAEQLAEGIEASAAWTDTVLDEHRIVFSPRAEAEQVIAHTMRIASMRARLGDAPVGDTSDHEQARAALRMEHDLLDQIVQSLRERVAALWSYAANVDELSSQIAALRAIENSMTLAPELDALARQTGLDELATRQLRALSADAETISVKIAAITATLTNALQPVSPIETPHQAEDRQE